MDSCVFVYDPRLTPKKLGICNVEVSATAKMYGSKLAFMGVNEDVCGTATLKSTNKNVSVCGMIYRMGSTTFKSYERKLHAACKNLSRTFAVVIDAEQHEIKCITYILDVDDAVYLPPDANVVSLLYKMYKVFKFDLNVIDVALKQSLTRFYNMQANERFFDIRHMY